MRDRRIEHYNTDRNTGDNFLFLPFFSGWIGKNIKHHQYLLFFSFLLLIFSALVLRITYLQIIRGSFYYAQAETNRLKTIYLPAPRGIVYDRFERALVENVSRFTVSINPILIASDMQAETLRSYLSSVFPDRREFLIAYFQNYKQSYTQELIADDIPYELALKLLIQSSSIAALQVSYEPRRNYLYPTIGLGSVLGYTGKVSEREIRSAYQFGLNDTIGKIGIEKQYDSMLRGSDGLIKIEVDALGSEKNHIERISPQKGTDMTLTIDVDVQRKLHEILTRISGRNGKTPAAGIIVEPATGEVLALSSVPSYDPNLFTAPLTTEQFEAIQKNNDEPFFMRAIAGNYPAGSIFKMAVAAAALEEGLIDDRFTIISTGGINLGATFFPDWKAGGHGVTNVYWGLADSVNTFFYVVGGGYENVPGLGVDAIVRYARKFGFGNKVGIDIPGENDGLVPSRESKQKSGERWYQGDTYNLSIGQGSLLVTPLQVAAYTSVFANRGFFTTPHLMREIHRENLREPYRIRQVPADFISPQTVFIIRSGLRQAVTAGTARDLQTVGRPVAGKTGTAQFSNSKAPHSWFTGFGPFEKPEIVVTILVEEGGNQNLAIDAAQEFFIWYFNRPNA